MKTGLVLEGGALRTIYSTGVMDAMLSKDLMVDYVIGVSAGIAYGGSYVSQQPQRNLEILTRFVNDRRYMGLKNLVDKHNRSYFGLEFSYETIPNELVPFDYDTFAAFPGHVEAVVTNLDTGKAEADLICLHNEEFDFTQPLELFDPDATWKRKTYTDYEARELMVPIFLNGELVYQVPDLQASRSYCQRQVDSLWDEVKRFENPHNYYVDLSQKLWDIKQNLLNSHDMH